MGCNAHNHSRSCNCGWGGVNYFTPTRPSIVPWLNGYGTYESFTIPNARCPVCGDQVFFIQTTKFVGLSCPCTTLNTADVCLPLPSVTLLSQCSATPVGGPACVSAGCWAASGPTMLPTLLRLLSQAARLDAMAGGAGSHQAQPAALVSWASWRVAPFMLQTALGPCRCHQQPGLPWDRAVSSSRPCFVRYLSSSSSSLGKAGRASS